jgi:AcrR family transcriptional regulator
MEACLARAALGLTNATPGAPRLQLLGRQIAELAGLPAADFTATIRKQLLDGASGVLIAHEQMLQGLPAASPWARDLRAFLPTLIQQLTAADPAAPMEMVERWGAARAPALTRELIARFGELLQAWPALFAAARELNRAGRGLWRGVGAGPLQKRLFAHFGSKEDLQIEILRSAAAQFEERVVRPSFRAPRGEPRIRQLFENWMRWLNDPGSPGGCIFMAAATELDDKQGRPRDFLVATQKQLLDAMARSARLAIEVGHFRADVDADQFAFELYSLLMGASHWKRLLRDPRAEVRARAGFERLLSSARITA